MEYVSNSLIWNMVLVSADLIWNSSKLFNLEIPIRVDPSLLYISYYIYSPLNDNDNYNNN